MEGDVGSSSSASFGDVWSPHMTYWTIQTVCQIATATLALWSPWVVFVAFAASAACWPYSLLTGTSVWSHLPQSPAWKLSMVIWIAACACASCPLLLSRIFRLRLWVRQCIGAVLHILLAGSILCTLSSDLAGELHKWNGVVGAMLVMSLSLKVVGVTSKGEPLVERGEGGYIVYFRPTPPSWLACYTVWNATFVWQGGLHFVLQDIYFWCFMFFCTYATGHERPVADTFGFSRALSLGSFYAVSSVAGLQPGLWAGAEDPPTQQYWFSLFLVYANALVLLALLIYDLYELAAAPGAAASGRDMEQILAESDAEEGPTPTQWHGGAYVAAATLQPWPPPTATTLSGRPLIQ